MTTEQYPGVKTAEFDLQATYTEGQIVGYRWYDKNGVKPAYPFGHGLSYGTFAYSNLKVAGRTISFDVKRTGGTGCDTPQVYLSFPTADSDLGVPSKELRFFKNPLSRAR